MTAATTPARTIGMRAENGAAAASAARGAHSSAVAAPPSRAIVAAVVPCYKVKRHIVALLERMGPDIDLVFVVDDACPEQSGRHVEAHCHDPRVRVVYHEENQGVGGAVMTGYRHAIAAGADVIVKIDGDGQMAPELVRYLVAPIVSGDADYAKGNRFYDLTNISRMPRVRILGNAALSFMSKLSTGYWDIFDPTNGFTAISAVVADHLPCEKISRRYFFETDLLFRLNAMRAVVIDIPMDAQYGEEVSNLRIRRVLGEFLYKHARNVVKRIFYSYFLRDLSIASLELLVGLAMLAFGLTFGGYHWIRSAGAGMATPAGTVMLAAMPVLLGIQLLLGFLGYDIASVPRRALHTRMPHGLKAVHRIGPDAPEGDASA